MAHFEFWGPWADRPRLQHRDLVRDAWREYGRPNFMSGIRLTLRANPRIYPLEVLRDSIQSVLIAAGILNEFIPWYWQRISYEFCDGHYVGFRLENVS